MTIQEAIRQVTSGGKGLTVLESIDVFTDIMSGKTTDAQIAAFIVALRMRGETPEEITGAATVMREKATHVIPNDPSNVVDTCGTGGDNAGTFNISTAAAFVPQALAPSSPSTVTAPCRASAAAPTCWNRWASTYPPMPAP